MLKAKGRREDGAPVMLLGLTGENVTRLVAGEPIVFDAAIIGFPPCDVVVVYGRREQDIVDMLKAGGGEIRPPG